MIGLGKIKLIIHIIITLKCRVVIRTNIIISNAMIFLK